MKSPLSEIQKKKSIILINEIILSSFLRSSKRTKFIVERKVLALKNVFVVLYIQKITFLELETPSPFPKPILRPSPKILFFCCS